MSLLGSLREKLTGVGTKASIKSNEAKIKTAKQHFGEFMTTMKNTPQYTFEFHRELMREQAKQGGITGWKSYLPEAMTGPKSPQMDTVKEQLRVLDSVEQADWNKPKLSLPEKKAMAKAADVHIEKVSTLYRQYLMQRAFHAWIHERVEKQLPLPEQQEELRELMREHPPKYPKEIMKLLKRRR